MIGSHGRAVLHSSVHSNFKYSCTPAAHKTVSTRATWHFRLRPTRCTCSFIERTEGSRREPRPRARTPVTQPQATASGVEAEPFWSRAASTEPPTCGATRCHHACQRHPSTSPNALDELRGFIPRPTNLGHRQLPRIARALSAAADGLATRSDGMPSHALGSTHRHTGVGTSEVSTLAVSPSYNATISSVSWFAASASSFLAPSVAAASAGGSMVCKWVGPKKGTNQSAALQQLRDINVKHVTTTRRSISSAVDMRAGPCAAM